MATAAPARAQGSIDDEMETAPAPSPPPAPPRPTEPEDEDDDEGWDEEGPDDALYGVDPAAKVASPRMKMGLFGGHFLAGAWGLANSARLGHDGAFAWGFRATWEPPLPDIKDFMEFELGFMRAALDTGTRAVTIGNGQHIVDLRAVVRWPDGLVGGFLAAGPAVSIRHIVYKVQDERDAGVVATGFAMTASTGVRVRWTFLRGTVELGTVLRGGPPDVTFLISVGGAGGE